MVGHASVARLDPHSYADSEQPVTERIDLALRVDFAQRVLSGEALLTLRVACTGPLDLDTRGLRRPRAGSIPTCTASASPSTRGRWRRCRTPRASASAPERGSPFLGTCA